MKKIYLMPTTKCVAIATEEMIAASGLFDVNSDGDPTQQDLSDAPTTDLGSGNLSRQGLWDFEEE